MFRATYKKIFSISTHAPVKGATKEDCGVWCGAGHFNPRTREGCDGIFMVLLLFMGDFNPRTREGCDS